MPEYIDWDTEETPQEVDEANDIIEADERRAFLKDELSSTLTYEEMLEELDFEGDN